MILALGIAGAVWVTRLIHEGVERRACIRRADASLPDGVHSVQFRGLTAGPDRSHALARVGIIVHVAARVHVIDDTATDPWVEFRHINVQGKLCLARQATVAGVRRFVLISSIKANGEVTGWGCLFCR